MEIETYEESGLIVPYVLILKSEKSTYTFFYEKNDIFSQFLNQTEKETKVLKIRQAEIFTHNINFAGFLFIDYFLQRGIPYKWYLREMNLYFLEFSYKGCEMRIRCSYKLLGTSLTKLGELINESKAILPYKFINKTTIDYKGETPNLSFFENEIEYFSFLETWGTVVDIKKATIHYATRNADIIFKALKELFSISNSSLIKNSFSISSYSYKLFSRHYDIKRITKVKNTLSVRNFIEFSYFGGRSEVFGNTKSGLIHRFDFAGMYGICMKDKFPYGEKKFCEPNDFKYPGFYSVTVKSDLEIPILPLRRGGGETIYPNGKFTTCLNRDEFLLFIEKGGKIEKINSAVIYEKEGYVFKDFVDNFTEMRRRGGIYKIYGKQMINGLYGSFALRKDKMRYIILHDENELEFLREEGKLKSFLKFNKSIIACIETEGALSEREDRGIEYAAFISSKARILLHKNVYAVDDYYKRKYGKNYKLLYLETDSIDVSLPENCLNEKIMDVCWQKVYQNGFYASPKFYVLQNENNAKIGDTKNCDYSYDKLASEFFESKKELTFYTQAQISKKDFKLIKLHVEKALKFNFYNKRIFSNDRLNTEAIRVCE